MYHFDSDYMEGAHPAILERLTAINFDKHDGYGCDSICDSARARIREACGAPGAEVHLLTGGTQTNATMIKALLRPFEGAVAADTGHINIHEAGAVEATGHKVLPLPHTDGKLCAETVARYIDDFRADGNRDHMVWPGMVYISQPTEYGTLYTLDELEALSRVCRSRSIPLYMDGARLGYALAAPACDMTLRDIARLCDIFYIGGTKCGALLGEAVVIPRAGLIPHLFTTIKQHGALLAKGWVLGVQFDTLFTDGLYLDIAREAIDTAARLADGLEAAGFRTAFQPITNQIFLRLDPQSLQTLSAVATFSPWEKLADGTQIVRLATSWATQMEEIEAFLAELGRK